jgi:hypothetical protein
MANPKIQEKQIGTSIEAILSYTPKHTPRPNQDISFGDFIGLA